MSRMLVEFKPFLFLNKFQCQIFTNFIKKKFPTPNPELGKVFENEQEIELAQDVAMPERLFLLCFHLHLHILIRDFAFKNEICFCAPFSRYLPRLPRKEHTFFYSFMASPAAHYARIPILCLVHASAEESM
jgi:hypothetical protein